MTDPLLRDVLRLIQDVVVEAKGSGLDRESERRVETALTRLAPRNGTALPDSGFSERDATVLFADLRGFSSISASYPAQLVLTVLGRCFGLMTEVVLRHYGTIDKFMGDGMMVVFNGEKSSPRDHAQRAVLCAVEMQIAMNELRQRHRAEGLPEIYIGIGINSGRVMAGLIGSDAYRAYTVIGEEVNLAARIEAFSLRGQVLMSEATYRHCADFVSAGERIEVHVKGRSEPACVRELLGIPELGRVVPRQELRKSPRVPIDLDVEYWAMAGKLVVGAATRGRIRNIGYHGLLMETPEPLQLYSEFKLAFDLPCLRYRVGQIYARVVSARNEGAHHRVGLEFTSVDVESSNKIQLFVQMCLQGEVASNGHSQP